MKIQEIKIQITEVNLIVIHQIQLVNFLINYLLIIKTKIRTRKIKIAVSKLTDDIIRAAIESFINSDDEVRWLKLYHIIPKLNIQEIDEILYRKKQEDIELDEEFEAESDIKNQIIPIFLHNLGIHFYF